MLTRKIVICKLFISVLLSIGMAMPVSAAPGDDFLFTGQVMTPGQSRLSTNGVYRFIFQHDGNLVVYKNEISPIWHSGTHGSNATRLIMQNDGNLVLYSDDNAVLWHSHTGVNFGDFDVETLTMQNDGNLVIYAFGGDITVYAVWDSKGYAP